MAVLAIATSTAIPTARSPAIDTEADSIFYVATNGGAYISDYISTYSYGHILFALRTRVGVVRIVSTQLVTSIPTVTVSTIPTVSPSTRDSGGTYLVYPDGIIPYNNAGYVGDSYGSTLRARFGMVMHVVSNRVVASTASAPRELSTIPTALRARTTPTMCVAWSRLVSSATTTVSTVPTVNHILLE